MRTRAQTTRQQPIITARAAAEIEDIETRLAGWRKRLARADDAADANFDECFETDFDVEKFLPMDVLTMLDSRAYESLRATREDAQARLVNMKAAWENLETRLDNALALLEELAATAPDSTVRDDAIAFLRAPSWKQAR